MKIEMGETMGKDDYGRVTRELLQKLTSWSKARQESQIWLDNLLAAYDGRFEKGIVALGDEVKDLKDQLSVVTRERNDLEDINKGLTDQIRQQRDKFAMFKTLLEMESDEDHIKASQQGNGSKDTDGNDEFTSESNEDFKEEVKLEEFTHDSMDCIGIGKPENEHENDFYEKLSNSQRIIYRNMLEKRQPLSANRHKEEENIKDYTESLNDNSTPKASDPVVISVIRTSKDTNNLDEKTKKQFFCDLCPYSSTIKKTLRAHKERVHDKIKKFACDDCDYAVHAKSDLKKHIEGVHARIRHICAECEKSFSQKAYLREHHIAVHSNEGHKLKCGSCPYTTANKKNLREHKERVHDKMKKYACEECDYAVHAKSDLKKHIEGVHARIRHICAECEKSFSQKAYLREHISKVHHNNY